MQSSEHRFGPGCQVHPCSRHDSQSKELMHSARIIVELISINIVISPFKTNKVKYINFYARIYYKNYSISCNNL